MADSTDKIFHSSSFFIRYCNENRIYAIIIFQNEIKYNNKEF